MLGLGLHLLLLAAPAATPTPPQVVPASAPSRVIARVWLHGVGLDEAALAEAVATRLTDKQILAAGQAAPAIDGPVALCHVTAQGGQLALEVVLGDGRVYQRTIAAKGTGRERAAARLIAATLASIEDETAKPDRSDGVFVAPVAAAETVEAPGSVEAPVVVPPPREPEATPPPPAREVVRDTTVQPAADSEPVAEARPTSAVPTLELGVALTGDVLFGLGAPTRGAGLGGGGGGVRIDLKLRRNLLLGAGFRGLVRVKDGLALGRFRGALGVGYLLRRGAFELATQLGPTLETWQVSEGGEPVTYTTTSSSGPSLLLGGLVRAAPGGRVQRRRVSARVGGYVELAGSVRSSGRVPQIAREAGLAPVFVPGGAELSLGVEVELWFVLRRGRR